MSRALFDAIDTYWFYLALAASIVRKANSLVYFTISSSCRILPNYNYADDEEKWSGKTKTRCVSALRTMHVMRIPGVRR